MSNVKPIAAAITPEAVSLFGQMLKTRHGSDQWWDLHAELWRELKLQPWQWPAIARPDDTCVWAAGTGGARWFPHAQQLYRQLAQAAQ